MSFPAKKSIALASAIVLIVLAMAVTVRLSMYRYDRISSTPVRINRITGTADILTGTGWVRMEKPNRRETPFDPKSIGAIEVSPNELSATLQTPQPLTVFSPKSTVASDRLKKARTEGISDLEIARRFWKENGEFKEELAKGVSMEEAAAILDARYAKADQSAITARTALELAGKERHLSEDELRLIEGFATLDKGYLTCSIYNRSGVNLSGLIVRLTIESSSGTVVSRDYQVGDHNRLAPLSSGSFGARTDLTLNGGQRFSCAILAGKGVPK